MGYKEGFLKGLAPDPILTVAEWSDAHRVMSSKSSPEPGPWRTSRTPYLREIMEQLSVTSTTNKVVLMKGCQLGAALALDTPIPTPKGWSTMGELQPGDYVLDDEGAPTKVAAVSPIYADRECYEVLFSDGCKIVADAEHKWAVTYNGKVKKWGRVLTTRDMAAKFKRRNMNIYSIKNTGALQLEDKKLPIPPYTLGAWLGDGSRTTGQITQHENDADALMHAIRADGMHAYVLSRYTDNPHIVIIRVNTYDDSEFCMRGHKYSECGRVQRCCARCRAEGFTGEKLKSFHGLLLDNGLKDKHIPTEYLRASHRQRLELLQGLMDTDGTCSTGGTCSFSNTNENLARGVYELALTLGLKPAIRSRPPSNTVSFGTNGHEIISKLVSYVVTFTAYRDITPVFKFARKLARMRASTDPKARPNQTGERRVTSISKVGTVPVKCICVDSPRHLYLCGESMIPTHNSELGYCWIGYSIHHVPCPMMLIQPTDAVIKRNVRQKIDPMIESTPALAALVPSKGAKDGGNNLESKEFPGGILIFSGANSSSSLRSTSIRHLMMDEIDEFPDDLNEQGDAEELADARTFAFGNKAKIYIPSTPTLEGSSKIAKLFARGDQRYYMMPCPHCGARIKFEFARLKCVDKKPKTVMYFCQECEAGIHEWQKTLMLEEGIWVPTNPEGEYRSYHLSSLYSPVGWLSWEKIMQKWFDAQDKPMKLKTFINTILGETFREHSDAPEWRRLYDKREAYSMNVVPARARVLTAFADVQKDRIEVEVVAWGPNLESWSLDYRVFMGDTAVLSSPCYDELRKMLSEQWPHELSGSAPLMLRRLGVDTGYNTNTVYNFCRQFDRSRVVPCKGVGVSSSLISAARAQDVSTGGRKIQRGIKLWHIGTHIGKSELYGFLRQDAPTDGSPVPYGYCHFPQYDELFFKMLTAETMVTKQLRSHVVYEWIKIYDRNEALDCRVGNRAMLALIGADRWKTEQWEHAHEGGPCASAQTTQPDKRKNDTLEQGVQHPLPSPPKAKRRSTFW